MRFSDAILRLPPAFLFLLAPCAAQRLLLTPADFDRIAGSAAAQPWARDARDAIVRSAATFPETYLSRYGLREFAPPPEGGQWTHWYVCPVHGASLQFQSPDRSVCPIDRKNYTGWPYDQVVYTRRNSDAAAAARDSGLAWQFTGERRYAENAARILTAYAGVYSSYRIKDTQNRPDARSGGRAFAQTLDESVWLIPMAWAYDLIASSGVLDEARKRHIENDLLRAAVAVIERNDAGISNWQSWHNAAIGAVGFALGDRDLIARAIDGPSGFRFQMARSVLPDGLWYEGAWGYHFYALDPLVQLAAMAARNGIDLYAERPLYKLFRSPLEFTLPDGTLPPFNDSRPVALSSQSRLYEIAYQRYQDPDLAAWINRRARGREALFWGAAELPAAAPARLPSSVFPESGNVFLRNAENDFTLAMKFGPHGGGHGHYDKLGLITFSHGRTLGVDPGTQTYGVPSHNTWDKATVAHNTVVVDESTQAEATGKLVAFSGLPSLAAVRANAGPAYRQANLERTLIAAPEYAIDWFEARATDNRPHRYDWLYHNFGALRPPPDLESYTALPRTNGYQHLTEVRAGETAAAWDASWDATDPENPSCGTVFTSPSSIRAAFEYSREQAASGRYSGRAAYDFSAAQGYALYTAAAPDALPAAVPAEVLLSIHGDGSRHRIAVRVYDATDERFVFALGVVDWQGWKRLRAGDLAKWTHYLGNNDGIVDLPLRSVSLELTSVASSPREGKLFVDDIAFRYAEDARAVTGFEVPGCHLRLWMLGEPGTVAAAGNGLGPDLEKPVPFVMARRRTENTDFVALLEPYADSPRITAFERHTATRFRVAGPDFDDWVDYTPAGELRFVRRAGTALRRLALDNARALLEDGRTLLSLDKGNGVQADFDESGGPPVVNVREPEPGAMLRIYAPAAREAIVNGQTLPCAREGDLCLVVLP